MDMVLAILIPKTEHYWRSTIQADAVRRGQTPSTETSCCEARERLQAGQSGPENPAAQGETSWRRNVRQRYAHPVNFFGHAAVASWRRRDAGYVLGAMLPDLATMIGARPPAVSSDDLDAGIRFHHETDRAFHGSDTFRFLERRARQDLQAHGLRRGSALAAAHVGIELLIDAQLSSNADAREVYLRAIEHGQTRAARTSILWQEPVFSDRFEGLCAVLAGHRDDLQSPTPQRVARRLARALAGRRRLAVNERGERIIAGWIAATQCAVAERMPALIAELTHALGA